MGNTELVRLRMQSSRSLTKISNLNWKRLGSSYSLKGKGPHKATVTSGANGKFRGFFNTTVSFDHLLAGFTELSASYCIHNYSYYRGRIKCRTRQRNRYAGPNLRRVQTQSFSCLLPKESWAVQESWPQCMSVCTVCYQPEKLARALASFLY